MLEQFLKENCSFEAKSGKVSLQKIAGLILEISPHPWFSTEFNAFFFPEL